MTGEATETVVAVGDRVVLLAGNAPYSGEEGRITNSPGRVFNGWTVRLDNGYVIGVDARRMRKVEAALREVWMARTNALADGRL